MVKDIMDALRGNIASLSSHSNGNHVIQRCLQYMPEEYRVDVFEEVVKSCVSVGVVQRCHVDIDSSPRVLRGAALSRLCPQEVPQHASRCHRGALGGPHLQPLRQLCHPVPNRARRKGGVREDHSLRAGTCGRAFPPEVQLECDREDPDVRHGVGSRRDRQGDHRLPFSANSSA